MVLSGDNTLSGASTVSQGLAQVGHARAWGTGGVTVSNAAALDLAGYSIANALTVAGTGVSNSGVLYNSASTAAGSATVVTVPLPVRPPSERLRLLRSNTPASFTFRT